MSRDWRWDDAVDPPAPVRVLNRLPDVPARRAVPLDPAGLVAAARARSGVDDLGPPEFWDGLVALTDALDGEARLSPLGRIAIRRNLVDALVARAHVLDWHAREPSIATEAVEAPVVIIGLPRTGTTLLSFLLQQDPRLRTLRHWEAQAPTPPPTLVEEATDSRVRDAEKQLTGLWRLAPGFRAIHPMEPAGATECVTVLTQSMASMQFETQCHVPGYADWMNDADLAPAYAHHRRVLQLLQWRSPAERWNLKTPAHLLALGTLLDTYPDARLIWTHRDPADVVGSVASLTSALQSLMSDDIDPRLRGPFWQERLATLVDRGQEVLDCRPGTAIAHMDYRDLVADPVAAVGTAYAALGLPLDDLARRRMQAWRDANPRDRWGRHRYDIAEFGIDADQVRERFGSYRRRYDLP